MNYAYALGFIDARITYSTTKMQRILRSMEEDVNRTEYIELLEQIGVLRAAVAEAVQRSTIVETPS